MNIYSLIKPAGTFFILVGALIMFGWLANIPILLAHFPNTPVIRFPTALTIFLAGVLLRAFNRLTIGEKKGDAIVRIMVCAALYLLIFFPHLMGYFWHIQVGLDTILDPILINGVLPQNVGPSIGTIYCMGVLFLMSFMASLGLSISRISRRCGLLLLGIGGMALMGYILNDPSLYFSNGSSQGMAPITAASFALIGFLFIVLGMRPHTDHQPDAGVTEDAPA